MVKESYGVVEDGFAVMMVHFVMLVDVVWRWAVGMGWRVVVSVDVDSRCVVGLV